MDSEKATDVNSNDQVTQVTPSDRLSEVLSISKLIPHQSPGKVTSLNDLIVKLRQVFDESDNIDIDLVQDLMASYNSNPRDWRKYCHFDRHRYTRNLVDTGNGKYNLMIVCWSEGQGSAIHDHPNSHCIMKILSGNLTEVRFAWPNNGNRAPVTGESEENSTGGSDYREMQVIGETELSTNDVAYINDSIGLHRMENKSHVLPAITLHLYVPPYGSCHMFDQRTGKANRCTVTFYSKGGKRTHGRDSGLSSKSDVQFENN